MRFGIRQPVARTEDARFLMERGRYVADIDLARQLYAVFVFSLYAHALIRSIDKAAAPSLGPTRSRRHTLTAQNLRGCRLD
jgi:aerobic carbon-monoxide dehydrogenase large subunit